MRQVWWRLKHPETGAGVRIGEEKTSSVTEIFVECDIAVGPYPSDDWLQWYEARAEAGEVERFKVKHLSMREGELDILEKGVALDS